MINVKHEENEPAELKNSQQRISLLNKHKYTQKYLILNKNRSLLDIHTSP